MSVSISSASKLRKRRPIFGLALSLPLLAVSCTEYDFYTQQQTDIFLQNSRNVVDVLLIVDNSCSMVEEQDKLAGNFTSFIQHFGGVDVDYKIGVITTDTLHEEFMGRMVGGDDEVIFEDSAGHELDRVAWDRDWDIVEGASLSLDPQYMTPSSNDTSSHWCLSDLPWDSGDLGTPGAANAACGETSNLMPDTGVDTGDTANTGDTGADGSLGEAPIVGDLVITEIMADSGAVEDLLGEWVEILNVSDKDLDLSACVLSDAGRNRFEIPSGTIVLAGETIVFGRTSDTSVNGGVDVDVAVGEAFTLNNNVTVITSATEGASEIFAEMVAVGITGSGIENGLEAAHMAFIEPLLSGDNAGFIREEANLSFIFVSDEDDSSPYPAAEYQHFFTMLKGEAAFRDHTLFNVSAVVGAVPPEFAGQPSCSSDHGDAAYGHRYVYLASETEGLVESICDEDFSVIAEKLGLILSGLAVEFELSELPKEHTLQVALYESADSDSKIADLVKDEDYEYISERNVIRFQEDQMPSSGWYIEVRYDVQSTGTNVEEGTGTTTDETTGGTQ
jgi:hypothetical protein